MVGLGKKLSFTQRRARHLARNMNVLGCDKTKNERETMTGYYEKVKALEVIRCVIKNNELQKKVGDSWKRADGSSLYTSCVHYRIKPPQETVPLELKDWAGGPWWVRENSNFIWRMVCGLDPSSDGMIKLWEPPSSVGAVCMADMMTWQRTKDFVTIEKCCKEEL